jgi:uncharacterized protein
VKVVADTMIWVSYCTLQDGYRHRLIERARRSSVRLFVSDYILDELVETLTEELGLSHRYARLARRAVLRRAKLVYLPPVIAKGRVADPADEPVLQTALLAKVDFLVTADKRFLGTKMFRKVRIVTAAEFERHLPPE